MKLERIDTSTTAGKAEVMRLADQGRTVVWRERGDAQWRRGPMPEWDWTSGQYAIIAEPAGPDEVWVVLTGCPDAGLAYFDKGVSLGFLGKPIRYVRAEP